MGSKIKNNDAFDARLKDKFNNGDFVSWQPNLNEDREYGIIMRVYSQGFKNHRDFMFAKVKRTDGKQVVYMLSQLTKES